MPAYISPLVGLIIEYKEDLKAGRVRRKLHGEFGGELNALGKFGSSLRSLHSFAYDGAPLRYTAKDMMLVSGLLQYFESGKHSTVAINELQRFHITSRIVRRAAIEHVPAASRDALWSVFTEPSGNLISERMRAQPRAGCLTLGVLTKYRDGLDAVARTLALVPHEVDRAIDAIMQDAAASDAELPPSAEDGDFPATPAWREYFLREQMKTCVRDHSRVLAEEYDRAQLVMRKPDSPAAAPHQAALRKKRKNQPAQEPLF